MAGGVMCAGVVDGRAAAMTATPGMSGKGKHQQAARQHDAEFAHELFPCN